MLTDRILPPDEWSKLADTELGAACQLWRPEDAAIVVVEDDGAIVATWALCRFWHVEGVWVAPSHRKRPGVVRRLLVAMFSLARRFGVKAAITGAVTDEVRKLLSHLDAEQLPGTYHVLKLRE